MRKALTLLVLATVAGAHAQLTWETWDYFAPEFNPIGVGNSGQGTTLQSDGARLWYWTGALGRLFHSPTGLENDWTEVNPITDPAFGLAGWNPGEHYGMGMALYRGWGAGNLIVFVSRWRDDNNPVGPPWEREYLVGYDTQAGLWRAVNTGGSVDCNTGHIIVDGALIAHQHGGPDNGHMYKFDLAAPWAASYFRRGFGGIIGDNSNWFSRVSVQALHEDGLVYTMKNDWTEGLSSGDRFLRYNPGDFTEFFPDIAATDLGQLPFQVGEGCALVSLPPGFAGLGLPQGGLFLLRGAGGPGTAPHEGRGEATQDYAIYDVMNGTWITGTLPGYSGSGGSAAFHDGRVYIKRGNANQGNDGSNGDIWVSELPTGYTVDLSFTWNGGAWPVGGVPVRWEARDTTSNSVVASGSVVPDSSGNANIAFPYSGSVRLWTKAAQTLGSLSDSLPGPGAHGSAFTLAVGDVDDSNRIDIDDFLILASTYEVDPPADPRADLTNDGAVNLDDFLLLASNYETDGAP